MIADTITALLDEAGFGSVTIVSEPLTDTMRFVAGRRTTSGARAQARP